MKSKILILIVLVFSLVNLTFSQTTNLPKFKKGTSYKTVRVKMIKAGWKPYHSPNADKCENGDARCQGRPEMNACAGTGMANCEFLWKRKGKTVSIFTVGDDAVYDGYSFQ